MRAQCLTWQSRSTLPREGMAGGQAWDAQPLLCPFSVVIGGCTAELWFLLWQENPQVVTDVSTNGVNANITVFLFMSVAQGVSVTQFGELTQIAVLIIGVKYA